MEINFWTHSMQCFTCKRRTSTWAPKPWSWIAHCCQTSELEVTIPRDERWRCGTEGQLGGAQWWETGSWTNWWWSFPMLMILYLLHYQVLILMKHHRESLSPFPRSCQSRMKGFQLTALVFSPLQVCLVLEWTSYPLSTQKGKSQKGRRKQAPLHLTDALFLYWKRSQDVSLVQLFLKGFSCLALFA